MSTIRAFFFTSIVVMAGLAGPAQIAADDNVIEAPPMLDTLMPADFASHIKLSAQETHSGLKLPRWVSLKHNTINGRKGPGKHFAHLWTFRRKGMPVIVVNEMDNWRKIRDIEGGESWVRSVALSGQDTGLVIRYTPLLKKAKDASPVVAQLSPNVLLKLKSCSGAYCAVEIDPEIKKGNKKGRKGYVARRDIWGVENF